MGDIMHWLTSRIHRLSPVRRGRLAASPRAEALEVRELPAGIVEYPVASLDARAAQITTGPDGNLWFTERGPGYLRAQDTFGKIGRITPSGTVTEFDPGRGHSPYGIVSANGSLWFTDEGTDSIGNITTAGVITEFPLSATSSTADPRGITVGPDGNLWFTEYGANKIGVFDPAKGGLVAEYDYSAQGLANPSDITAGPDGNIWFDSVDQINAVTVQGAVNRISPSGQFLTSFDLPSVTGSHGETITVVPQALVAGPDGNVWLTSNFGGVYRATPAGDVAPYTISYSDTDSWLGPQLGGITVGPDANLWFTDLRNAAIGRITTAGVITETPVPGSPHAPVGITTGPDKNIWFTDEGATMSFNPAKNAIGTLTLSGTVKPSPNPSPSPPDSGNPPTDPGTSPTRPGNPTKPPRLPVTPVPLPTSPVPTGGPTTPHPTRPVAPRTPPRIISVREAHPRGGPIRVVLKLDQAIGARPRVPVSSFALGVPSSAGTSVRLAQASYNALAHTVTVVLRPAPRTVAVGTIPLTVLASHFSNARRQSLDGNGDGTGGDDFVTLVTLG